MSSSQPVRTTKSALRSSFTILPQHRLRWIIGIVAAVGLAIAAIVLGGGGSGASWQSVNAGAGRPTALTVDPVHSAIALGNEQGEVLTSNDSGETWHPLQPGLPTQQAVNTLLVLPDGSRYLAGTSKGIYATTGTQPWQAINNGLPPTAIFDALVVATADNQTLLAGSTHDGIFITHNGGLHWTAANAGLPARADIYTLLVSADFQTIWAGTVGAGIYQSSDSGASWQAANVGLPAAMNVFALVQTTPKASTVVRLLAGTNQGIFSSDDNGGHWQASSIGIGNRRVLALGLRPAISSWIVAGTDSGVALSIDYGVHWQSLTKGIPANTQVGQLLLIKDQQTTVFATGDRLYRFPGRNNPIFSGALRIIGFLVLFGLLFWISRRQNTIIQSMMPAPRPPSSTTEPARPARINPAATKRVTPAHIRGGPPPAPTVLESPPDKEP